MGAHKHNEMDNIFELVKGKTVLLSTKKHSHVSDLIAGYAGSKLAKDVSHSAVLSPDGMVTEALGDRDPAEVVDTPFAEIVNDIDLQYIYLSIPRFQPEPAASKKWLNERIGCKYDYANLFFIQLPSKWLSWLPFQRKTKNAEKKYICSELVAHFGRTFISNYIFGAKPISDYNPSELLDLEIRHIPTSFDVYYYDATDKTLTKI